MLLYENSDTTQQFHIFKTKIFLDDDTLMLRILGQYSHYNYNVVSFGKSAIMSTSCQKLLFQEQLS